MLVILCFLLITATTDTLIYTLKTGQTIEGILEKAKLPQEDRINIISSLSKEMDMRRCLPGDKVIIATKDGRFLKLRYETKRAIYDVDSLFTVSKIGERKVLAYISGSIEGSSLWEAMLRIGESGELAVKFADEVFPWDIDFNVETQKGDSFEVLVPKIFVGNKFVEYGKILFARYKTRRKDYVGIYYLPSGSTPLYCDLQGKSLRRFFLRAPLSYVRISSRFSYSRLHPILRIRRPHFGIDYAAPMGTPVRSIGDGIVTFVGWRGDYGRQVIIKHKNGYKSYYGHLHRFAKGIKKGKFVKQGDIIGYVGMSGLATGPHLDFRISRYGKWLDYLKLRPPPVKPLDEKELKRYENYKEELFALLDGVRGIESMYSLLRISNSLTELLQQKKE